jgi:hypothetical protein
MFRITLPDTQRQQCGARSTLEAKGKLEPSDILNNLLTKSVKVARAQDC